MKPTTYAQYTRHNINIIQWYNNYLTQWCNEDTLALNRMQIHISYVNIMLCEGYGMSSVWHTTKEPTSLRAKTSGSNNGNCQYDTRIEVVY